MTNLERHGRPLIEAIAAWERENGTVCGILPQQYFSLVDAIEQAALMPSCSARAALDEDPITLYSHNGETIIDFADHVELENGAKFVVLVTLIYDDGEHVGPENTDAVCPNLASAAAYVERQFNSDPIRLEKTDDDLFAPGRLFFRDRDLNQTLCIRLIPWKTA